MMEVIAKIDADRGDDSLLVSLKNFDEGVRFECRGLFEGGIYMDRAELIRALCALDVAS